MMIVTINCVESLGELFCSRGRRFIRMLKGS